MQPFKVTLYISRSNGQIQYSCYGNEKICATRTTETDDYYPGDYWGRCSNCSGETPTPSSKYNLASFGNGIWKQNFYDLSPYGSGFCETYDPPSSSYTNFENRAFMLLGDLKRNNVQW